VIASCTHRVRPTGAGEKGRREVDAHSRQRTAPLAGKSLAGANRPGASFAGDTRLTLWHNIDRRFIAWGTAGWHIAFDVLDRLLGGQPIGRIVDADAMKFAGWQRLYVRFFAGFTSSLPFRSSAMFIARLTRFQTTPDLLGLFSFLCWPIRDFGCGKVMSFGGLFRNGPFRRNGATRGRGNAP